MNAEATKDVCGFIEVRYFYYSDTACLQQQLDLLTKRYYAAIRKGEVFKHVKKIFLAMKEIKAELKERSNVLDTY